MNVPYNLADLLRQAVRSLMEGVHTCLPGVVEAYDAGAKKASVRPVSQRRTVDGGTLSPPVISDVPVVFPRTSDASISFPLGKGDPVLLVFSERSLDAWLNGQADKVPADPRQWDLTDAIAIPGLFGFGNGPAVVPDALNIKYKDASVLIKSDGQVDINDGNLTVEL